MPMIRSQQPMNLIFKTVTVPKTPTSHDPSAGRHSVLEFSIALTSCVVVSTLDTSNE